MKKNRRNWWGLKCKLKWCLGQFTLDGWQCANCGLILNDSAMYVDFSGTIFDPEAKDDTRRQGKESNK